MPKLAMFILLIVALALVFRTGIFVPYTGLVSIGAAGQAVHAVHESQPAGVQPDVNEIRSAVQDSLMRSHGFRLTAILLCDFLIWSIVAVGIYVIAKKSESGNTSLTCDG